CGTRSRSRKAFNAPAVCRACGLVRLMTITTLLIFMLHSVFWDSHAESLNRVSTQRSANPSSCEPRRSVHGASSLARRGKAVLALEPDSSGCGAVGGFKSTQQRITESPRPIHFFVVRVFQNPT